MESAAITNEAAALEISLKQELDETTRWEGFAPFALSYLPSFIRESHKDLYEPRVVSIGPFHRGKESLSALEAHKARCLVDFLDRNTNISVEVYIQEIRKLEDRARHCYSEAISMSKDEFVRMLLLDGCFILEFFFKIRAGKQHMLLDVGWGKRTTISDLLLFENQIPFFIIEKLYAVVTNYESNRDSLLFVLQPYSIAPDLTAGNEIFHLLHLYHQWFIPHRISKSNSNSSFPSLQSSVYLELPSQSKQIPPWLRISSLPSLKTYEIPMRSIPSATELHEAGVTFKKKEIPCNSLDITFERGVLMIPTFPIDSAGTVLPKYAVFELSSARWNTP